MSAQFRTSLRNNFAIFETHAFRKHKEGQAARSVINASLWDVMTTGLSRYPEHLVEAKSFELKNAFYKLMEDTDFIKSITYGVNDINRVKERFKKSIYALKGVFDD